MNGVHIRPATQNERATCRSQWLRMVTRRPVIGDGSRWAPFGRGQINVDVHRDQLERFMEMVNLSSDIDVLDLGGEVLGFVAHEPGLALPRPLTKSSPGVPTALIHYIHVVGEARRKGLGTLLFRHAAQGEYTPTFMTDAGRALIESTAAAAEGAA